MQRNCQDSPKIEKTALNQNHRTTSSLDDKTVRLLLSIKCAKVLQTQQKYIGNVKRINGHNNCLIA